MKKEWNSPVIEALDLSRTFNSIQENEEPDGVFGQIFPGGTGRECCS